MNRRRTPHTQIPPKIEAFTTDEITNIFKAVKNSEYIVPVVLGLFAGLREGETLALRWSDISFEQNTISVTKAILPFTHEINVPKSIRTIKISPHLKAFLANTKERQQKQKELAGDSWQDNIIRNTITNEIETIKDFVNIHPKGDMLTASDLKRLSTALATQGIKFKFHYLRHTYTTRTLSDEALQECLGSLLQLV